MYPKDTNTMVDKEKDIRAELRPVDWARIVFTSAKSGQRVPKLLEAVKAAGEEHRRRIATATLNMVVQVRGRKGRASLFLLLGSPFASSFSFLFFFLSFFLDF
jgi:predicted GTPase